MIIRPRGGDFLYTGGEHTVMLRDIDAAKKAGTDGVVVGVLDANAQVDEARTRELVERARPMSVTFHRAFDMARDPSPHSTRSSTSASIASSPRGKKSPRWPDSIC